jgi:DNA polymerase elongation subunit (family B)
MSGKLQGVDLVEEPGRWILRTKSTGDVIPGRFVVLLDETGDVTVEKLKVLEIRPGKAVVVEAPTDDDFDTSDAVKWAMVKDDVSPADIFRLDRGSSADRARIASYCIQDCDLTYELYKKLDVFNNAMAMANTCPVPVSYIFTRGQGIKAESLIYKECLASEQLIKVLPNPNRGSVEESYEGAIVLDPVPGFYFESPVGVADFASLYPSTIESENISHDSLVWTKDFDTSGNFVRYRFMSPGYTDVACKCRKDGTCGTMKDGQYVHHVNELNSDEREYIGKMESDAARLHEIAVEKLQSSYFPGKTHGFKAGAPLSAHKTVDYTDIEFDIWGPHPDDDAKKMPRKVIVGRRVCRYAQPAGNAKGTLPTIVQKLLAARKAKRKEAEKENDPFRKALLDAEQLAYKLTANSLYGQLGSSTFKIRLQDLAASVTAYGRKQILFARDVITEFYKNSEIVYGDTDSLFVNFNPRDEAGKRLEGLETLKRTIHLTAEAGKFVTKALKSPHDFEYDKVFYPFIIFSKKRYVGNKYEEDPEHFTQTSMGIVLKRRDNASVVKTIYGGAINILLNKRDIVDATHFVKEKTADLVDGRMSLNQLTISKSLRSEYKTPSPPAHKMLADRMKARDPGSAPASGDRIPYVYIAAEVGQEVSKLQGDRIEHPSYVKEKGLKLDAKYYIERQLMNPVSQLFSLCVTQMPGYVATNEDPERVAGRLLFDDALNSCDKASTRSFAGKFGMTVVASAAAKKTGGAKKVAAVLAVAPPPVPKKQAKIDMFMFDMAMIEANKKKKKADKDKADKEKKAEKKVAEGVAKPKKIDVNA